MNDEEQQKVSACLLARVNLRGQVVQIDMAGPMEDDLFAIPIDPTDGAWQLEGAFFGNLFTPYPQAYVCAQDGAVTTMARSCLLGDTLSCGVMDFIGSCVRPIKATKLSTNGCSIWGDGYYLGCFADTIGWQYAMTTYVARTQ